MPELPEVEHVVRSLRRSVLGSQIVASEINLPKLVAPLSGPSFSRKIKGSRIKEINRRGKYILFELEKPRLNLIRKPPPGRDQVLAVHLRMTGQFLVLKPDDSLPRHAHAIFYLDDERRLVFRDQRQFGVMRLVSRAELNETKGYPRVGA